MNAPVFVCNCTGGETRVIGPGRIEHKCGFRPSASYGELGRWTPKVVDAHGRWWTDWQSMPNKSVDKRDGRADNHL